ncbi:MFS general substrate transporter [Lactarius hatsudake]|nr:MFS general substrate transporter [Lactarius hatsudake]
MSPSPPRSEDDHLNEDSETPLLPKDDATRSPTPLPRLQIAVILSIWLVESIISSSISPYLNQLVRELPIVGGDGRRVGYYTGIIVSAHYAAEAVTVFYWSSLSDHIGRKPVLLLCLIGVIVSVIMFGLSRSFWAIVFSRSLHGALKGHVGVVKSMMAELTDETNVARGFSMLPMSQSLGYAIGWGHAIPTARSLARRLFTFLLGRIPILPSVLCGRYLYLCFAHRQCHIPERVKCGPLTEPRPSETSSDGAGEESASISPILPPNGLEKPPPLRSILTRPVLISISSYAMLSLLGTASDALIPLVWSTSVEFGGLGLSPASIGLWMSGYGWINGIVQYVLFPRFVSRLGLRRAFLTSVSMCALTYALFPFENLALRHASGGSEVTERLLIMLQLLSAGIADMGYSAIYMYISSAIVNKRSLGAVYGLAQMVGSIQRMVGPAAADWLFAFSLTNNVLGGNFAYVILIVLVGVGLCVSAQLPRNTWSYSSN